MFGEMIEIPTWSPIVADAIAQDLQDSPLLPGQDIVLVGESGGGTVAIEALDLLEVIGIEVDQVILRGSPVHELFLSNVNRVDYITSKLDYYYSFDVNPVDGVQVKEYRIDFWGHVPPDNRAWMEIGLLIHNLILEGR